MADTADETIETATVEAPPELEMAEEAGALVAEGDELVEDSLEGELSQDEIDSLLGIAGSEEASSTGIQAVINSSRVTYERLPILEVIFDRLVRNLSTALRNFTGEIVDVSLDRLDSIRFGDYMDSLPLPVLINIFDAKEWETSALIMVDTPLVYSIVDILLGGRKGPGITRVEGRPYTSIERNLVERVIKLVLDEFTKSFSLFEPVTFAFRGMEINPRFATIVRPVNACILTRLRIEMEGRGGVLEFLIPYSSLEPVRNKLLQMVMGEKFGNDNIWEEHLGQQLWDIHVDLKAELEPVPITLNDIMHWKPGDQIIFKEKPDSLVSLTCGNYPLFNGHLGQREGKVSVKIEDIRKFTHAMLVEDQ